MRLKPSEIFYSQDSICKKFNNGDTIYSTLNECRDNLLQVDSIPNIRVCPKNGRWYTLDNRRLWGFKRLEEEGRITDIEVDTVGSGLLTAEKFTTENGGVSIRIRSSCARWSDDEDDDGGLW